MTTTSNKDIARAIYSLSKDKTHSEQSVVCGKVVQFLFRQRLFSKINDILSELKKIINKEENKISVKLSSVEKINHQTKTHLEHAIKKRYSAKEVVFTENLDAKLLGGFRMEVNDEVIDFSIKNKIAKLQEHLIKSV